MRWMIRLTLVKRFEHTSVTFC